MGEPVKPALNEDYFGMLAAQKGLVRAAEEGTIQDSETIQFGRDIEFLLKRLLAESSELRKASSL